MMEVWIDGIRIGVLMSAFWGSWVYQVPREGHQRTGNLGTDIGSLEYTSQDVILKRLAVSRRHGCITTHTENERSELMLGQSNENNLEISRMINFRVHGSLGSWLFEVYFILLIAYQKRSKGSRQVYQILVLLQ